jgi:hypothetical protein
MRLNTQRARAVHVRLAAGAAAGLAACLLSSAAAHAATTRLAGTDAVGTHVSSANPGNAEAYKTAGSVTGDATSIVVHLDAATTTNAVEVGVYSDEGGRPATLLTSARSNAPVAGWNQIAVPSARLEAGTPYWIAVLNPNDASGSLAWSDRAGGTGGEEQTSGVSELVTLPDEWVNGRNFSDGPLSAYVVGDEHVPPGPALAVTPSALSFWSTAGAGSPAPKVLNVGNSGEGSFTYTVSESTAWLTASPASGSAPGNVTVTVNTTGLAAGTYTGSVTITAPDAAESPREVPVTLTVNPARTANGLVGAWAFEETSGDSALDTSGRRNTGALQGPTRTANGMYGRGLVFDGADDWVTIADNATLDLRNAMTLEAWVKPDALANVWRTILIKEQTSQLSYALYANTDAGGPSGHAYTDRDNGVAGPDRLPQGEWSHVATTWDGATLRVYVNGAEVASIPLEDEIRTSSGALRIGGNAIWGEWFDGQIDEVRVYNRALSPEEILADRDTPISKGSGSEMSPLEKLKALLLKLLARWKEHWGNWSWHDWRGGHFKGH